MTDTPFLSIVVTGRNDDYGGQFARRFIRALTFNIEQLANQNLSAEILLVEWSPVPGRRLLAEEVLTFLPPWCHKWFTSFIVDSRYQEALSLNPNLGYLEYIAKNVGIRRAKGHLILATNTDILFSSALISKMSAGQLIDGRVYRANRIDLKLGIDESRLHNDLLDNPNNHVPRTPIKPPLYAGAAGDFILLDRETLKRLRGFNEVYRMARFGVDHNFLIKARSSGIPIEDIEAPVYHISHTTSFQVAKHIATPKQAERLWGSKWHNHNVIYDNPEEWGLGNAPVTRIGERIWQIDFDWISVAPLTDLRRIVLADVPELNC
ncbi:MAG: hypothetical protein CL484_04260 [Acidobacteria bacterium]|nr:hypothetical protein [Acidobacteriota bacterium]